MIIDGPSFALRPFDICASYKSIPSGSSRLEWSLMTSHAEKNLVEDFGNALIKTQLFIRSSVVFSIMQFSLFIFVLFV